MDKKLAEKILNKNGIYPEDFISYSAYSGCINLVYKMGYALSEIKEAINNEYSDDYVFEENINNESHLGKITITVGDARNVIKSLRNSI